MEAIDSGHNRETLVFIAKLAEKLERYNDMAIIMNRVAKKDVQLSPHERNLLGIAYRSVIVSQRVSWGILSELEKDSSDDLLKLNAVQKLKQKVETQITDICNHILSVIDGHLIPSTEAADASLLYHTLKGDHYMYLAGIKNDADRQEDVKLALRAYEAAANLAKDIPIAQTDGLRLHLSFAIFCDEILKQPLRAWDILDDIINGVELCHPFPIINEETAKTVSTLEEKWRQLFSELFHS